MAPVNKILIKELIMLKQTESVIFFCCLLFMMLFEALEELLSIFKSGIAKPTKVLPIKKSEKELKKMLKKDLVDLVLAYQ